MAESHIVSALAKKRAEIAGMIARAQQQLGQFRADLVHLDATIRLFAPAMEPETISPKRIRQSDLCFEPGGLSRGVLDALRRAGAPIHAPDLVRAVMIDTGLDPADRASFVRVQWKLLVAGFLLCRLREHERFVGAAELPPRRVDFVTLRAERPHFFILWACEITAPPAPFYIASRDGSMLAEVA